MDVIPHRFALATLGFFIVVFILAAGASSIVTSSAERAREKALLTNEILHAAATAPQASEIDVASMPVRDLSTAQTVLLVKKAFMDQKVAGALNLRSMRNLREKAWNARTQGYAYLKRYGNAEARLVLQRLSTVENERLERFEEIATEHAFGAVMRREGLPAFVEIPPSETFWYPWRWLIAWCLVGVLPFFGAFSPPGPNQTFIQQLTQFPWSHPLFIGVVVLAGPLWHLAAVVLWVTQLWGTAVQRRAVRAWNLLLRALFRVRLLRTLPPLLDDVAPTRMDARVVVPWFDPSSAVISGSDRIRRMQAHRYWELRVGNALGYPDFESYLGSIPAIPEAILSEPDTFFREIVLVEPRLGAKRLCVLAGAVFDGKDEEFASLDALHAPPLAPMWILVHCGGAYKGEPIYKVRHRMRSYERGLTLIEGVCAVLQVNALPASSAASGRYAMNLPGSVRRGRADRAAVVRVSANRIAVAWNWSDRADADTGTATRRVYPDHEQVRTDRVLC
jgi:hypothetical protein